MLRFTVLLMSFALLAGCATMDEAECNFADWYAVGFEDGSKGRNLGYIARHAKACERHGITPQQSPWKRGHAEGLKVFCVPESAHRLGTQGRDFPTVCHPHSTREMFDAWEWGSRYHDISQQIELEEDHLDALEEERAQALPDDPIIARLNSAIFRTRHEIQRLEWRRKRYGRWPPR